MAENTRQAISETRQMIASLRQSEEYVQSLIAHLNEYLIELEGRVVDDLPPVSEPSTRHDH